jgi:hypothetical protein
LSVAFLATIGCGATRGKAIPAAAVDSSGAASAIIAEYDKDHDGLLNREEVKAFPPLAAAAAAYDSNGDSAVSEEELDSRLNKLFNSSASLTGVRCEVTQAGRPLSGARVLMRPVAMLADAIKPAEGTTDEFGVAMPAISDANLPNNLKGTSLMYPGLYHVEITHPGRQLPAKFNTASELGCEIDPVGRNGSNVKFAL